MPKQYRACLIGCGRMGATIDDEMAGRPERFLWIPYSHAAAAVACDRTDLVAVSDVIAEKAETARQRYGAQHAYTDYREMIEKVQPTSCALLPVRRNVRSRNLRPPNTA